MRAAGLTAAALAGPGLAWSAVPFRGSEPEAEAQLGTAAFRAWALRGYFEHA